MGLKYGQGKYGQFRYGKQDAGFQFLVKISNSAGTLLELENNEVSELSWNYKKYGGCDKFKCVLKRKYDVLTNLSASNLKAIYDFQVYVTSGIGGSSVIYYRGYIDSIRPSLQDSEEVIISGQGYSNRLDEIMIHDGTGAPKEYTLTTISALVTSIYNDFIDPNTAITLGTVDTFSTSVTSIKFNGTVLEAIKKLADIVDAEWGVDRNLAFYFLIPSESVGFRWFVGRDIGELSDELDYSDIMNRVLIEGGDIDDGTGTGSTVPFRYVKSNQASIDLFGLKERLVSNSSVIDSSVAEKLADSILFQQTSYQRNSELNLPFNKTLIESSVPIPMVAIHKNPKQICHKYGTFKYGAQKYSGEPKNRIFSISYSLKDLSLDTDVELNFGKPDVTENFKVIEFELEQQRQAQGV